MDFASTSYEDEGFEELHSVDVFVDEVETTFWIIVVVWVMCSVAWVTYCVVSHKREMEKVKEMTRENRVSRYIELQRLLQAYDSVDIERGPTAPPVVTSST